MIGHFGNGHHLAQLINVIGQPPGNSNIRVKEFQVLDANASAHRAIKLAVVAIEPDLSCGQVQIANSALGPTVSDIGFMATSMAYRFKTLVRQDLYRSHCRIWINALIDNFYSTKGEIRCYG